MSTAFQPYYYQVPNQASATAFVVGAPEYAGVRGRVRFIQTPRGVEVTADVTGLPPNSIGFYAFHLHEGPCGGAGSDPARYFAESGDHYNPAGALHPRHAGDFPPLLATAAGTAHLSFLTDRFPLRDVIGRSVIIHFNPDDFKTQPSGDAGRKMACGVIVWDGVPPALSPL